MTIREIQAEAHANAIEKGFWEVSQNIPEKLMLIMDELFREALNAHLDDLGTSMILEELADAQIRTADLAGHLGVDLESDVERLRPLRGFSGGDFLSVLASVGSSYCHALKVHRAGGSPGKIGFWLAEGWVLIECAAETFFRGDLREALLAKMDINRGRERLHGKRY